MQEAKKDVFQTPHSTVQNSKSNCHEKYVYMLQLSYDKPNHIFTWPKGLQFNNNLGS